MGSATFPGSGAYRLDQRPGADRSAISAWMGVTKTSGYGYYTRNPQGWAQDLGGSYFSGTWTYDFSGAVPKEIGIASNWVSRSPGNYAINCWADMDSGFGRAYVSDSVAVRNVPGAPYSIAVDQATSSSLRYRFSGTTDGNSPIREWQIAYSTSPSFSGQVFYVGSTGTTTIGALASATTWYFRARGRNDIGWSGWSDTMSGATLAVSPGAVASLKLTAMPPDGVRVEWTPPSSTGGKAITGYDLQIAESPNFAGIGQTTVASSTRSWDFTGRTPGKVYYVRMRANNPDALGAWSETLSVLLPSGAKVRLDDGTWKNALVKVWTGTTWRVAVVKVWTGSGWKAAR